MKQERSLCMYDTITVAVQMNEKVAEMDHKYLEDTSHNNSITFIISYMAKAIV